VGRKKGGVVGLEQLDQWRAQLKEEPSTFARDLAQVLLLELQRLQAAELACDRRYAATQAGFIRAQLATGTECQACSDSALRHAEERLALVGTFRAPTTTVVVTAGRGRPRFS
jgi:hypothetical protein